MTVSPPGKRLTRRLLIPLTLVLAGFVALNVSAYRHAHAMMHYAPGGTRTSSPEALSLRARSRVLLQGVHVPRPVGSGDPSALGPGCRSLTIAASGDVTLGAWYCDAGENSPLVILFHGYTAEKSAMVPEARIFIELGASVLLVDFRGSGESSESYTTLGVLEADDVAAVFGYARDGLHHPTITLFGQSMGAAAILRAVHRLDIAPDGVILEAIFDTMLSTVRNRFRAMGIPSFPSAELLVFWGGCHWGFNGFTHNPVTYATSVRCPVLFMHGADDPRTTLAESRRVFAAVTGRKTFREFASIGHASYATAYPGAWKRAVGSHVDLLRDAAAASSHVEP